MIYTVQSKETKITAVFIDLKIQRSHKDTCRKEFYKPSHFYRRNFQGKLINTIQSKQINNFNRYKK